MSSTLAAIAAEHYPGIPEAAELLAVSMDTARGEAERQAAAARLVALERAQSIEERAKAGGRLVRIDVDAWEQSREKREDVNARARPKLFSPVSVGGLYDSTSDSIDWLVEYLVPSSALVLLAAFMKAGKTTLAYALVAALLRGAPFLGRRTRETRVLLLALEENRRDVKRRLLKFGVQREAGLFVQFRPVPTGPAEWSELVAFVQRESIGLLVIDTLSRCWPVWGVDNENDNAKVARALAPVLDLCREQNLTALLLHHTGKLAEGQGREVRGAGAILALADQALLFDRYRAGDPCDRIIRTLGRYDESPAELVIRYDRGAAEYVVLEQEEHDEEARGAERLFPHVLTYLRTVGASGASLRSIRSNVHGARNTVRDRAVGLLLDQGKTVLRDGRYFHTDHDPRIGRE